MKNELWQAFVQIAGGVNALLLGLILMGSPRLHRTRARQKLGLALLAFGYLLFSFTAVDNLWIPALWWIWLIDYVVVLLASALFLDYMHGAVGGGNAPRLCYLPPLIFLPVALFLGPDFIAGPAIIPVVVIQITYSALTTLIFVRTAPRLANRPRHLLFLLLGLWSLHAFQLARMFLPGSAVLFDSVPLVAAALMLILTSLVLTDSRTLRSLSQVAKQPLPASTSLDAVREYMELERPHLDPGLSLEQLANALGTTRGELSRLIGETTKGNFYDFVNHYRVAQAKQFLTDPEERRTSIEAIGLMSGFRARSTFYEAFRKNTEVTPARYRKDANSTQS
jgi:AraC-like DNA-binding protein